MSLSLASRTRVLRAALFTPSGGGWGLPICLWGPPGVGKTSCLQQLASRHALAIEVLSPGERGEGAFGVVPVPSADGVLEYPRPTWTRKFDEDNGKAKAAATGGRGIVVVTEGTTAPPALQPALLGLVLDGRIGGHQLPPGVRRLLDANPPEEAAAGYDLAPPLANRMGHLDWPAPTTEEHVAYMLGGAGSESEQVETAWQLEARVAKAWAGPWAKAVGLETAFIQRRGSAVKNLMPKPGDPKAGRAWPSDRSWVMATRALASASIHGLSAEETEVFVSAFVGAAAASELFQYAEAADLPDPAALLDGREKFRHDARRLDRTMAAISSCAALVVPKDAAKRQERGCAFWNFIADLLDGGGVDADLAVPGAEAVARAHILPPEQATRALRKILPVLNASGFSSMP